jgi:hypothetical protein
MKNSRDYSDKKIAILYTLKNRTHVGLSDGEFLHLLPNSLFTISQCLSNFKFQNIDFYFADFHSTDSDLEKELPSYVKENSNISIMNVEDKPFGRGPGFNYLLDNIKESYHAYLFLDADMIYTRDTIFLRGFEYTIRKEMCYFPVCHRLSETGSTKPPESDGYGIVFVPGKIVQDEKPRFIDKYTWGKEDFYFAQELQKHSQCVQEVVTGFYHQWHPVVSFKD